MTDIRPFNDQQTAEALRRVAGSPMLPVISKYLFPDLPITTLGHMLKGISSVTAFQDEVMIAVVEALIAKTTSGLSCSGQENLAKVPDGRMVIMSNHRDIVLDPAFIDYLMHQCGYDYPELCIGSNLLSGRLVEDLMRSNRMITVIRGVSAKEMYANSKVLSAYLRERIVSGGSSIWIAQREGRTKDGNDVTEQGILKMFDMSGTGGFEENFDELHIVPACISYEYEPCDAKKAREVIMRKSGPYVKKKNEDLHSILTGIRQIKGHVHIHFCEPLSSDELAAASALKGNERYQHLCKCIDTRIKSAYRIYKTNMIAYDMLTGSSKFRSHYSDSDFLEFDSYLDHKSNKIDRHMDAIEFRTQLLKIYAGPILHHCGKY